MVNYLSEIRTGVFLISFLFVLFNSSGFVTSYGIRLQEQPFVTGTTGAPGGFGGCAACRAVCDCACVRRTCTDTSCCGQGGFGSDTTLPSSRYRQDIFEDPRFRFMLSLPQKWRYLVKRPQWILF